MENATDLYSSEKMLREIELKCYHHLNTTRDISINAQLAGSGAMCPGTFDGWACWDDTPAGHTAFAPCPEFVTGFDPNRMAHKDCDANGSWFRHPESGQVWSNYTTCVNIEDLNRRQQVIKIYETGYMISLVALLVSLGILSYFKSLRCSRITLHMNLFASFAMNNALWVLWYGIVVQDPDVTMENGVWCRILHVVLHYFLLTNYAWMLCEGFYLHTLLVSAFVSESLLLKWLYVLGWAMPGLAIVLYAALRGSHSGDDNVQ